MSLPRRRPSEPRSFQHQPAFTNEPDFSVVMPAVRKLRAAEDQYELDEALAAIPAHLIGRVAAFAGERHDILPKSVIRALLDTIGIEAFYEHVGIARASVVWRRYHAKS